MEREKGFSLLEVIIAIALIGIVAVAFLGALATGSKAIFIADERATAESLARSQMEYVKNCDYEPYDPVSKTPYTKNGEESSTSGYFIWIDAFPIHPDTGALLIDPDNGQFLPNPETPDPDDFYSDEDIQKIIVTVKHGTEAETAKQVLTLEDYKVDR
jgi:prepilin-type N-terminal cleavage/methylation domain-containing protein